MAHLIQSKPSPAGRNRPALATKTGGGQVAYSASSELLSKAGLVCRASRDQFSVAPRSLGRSQVSDDFDDSSLDADA